MKRLIAVVAVLVAMVGGAAIADPGPNGNNNHGLCTAYFNGSENGRNNKRQAGPFVALANHVGQNDGIDNDDDGGADAEDPEGDEMAGPEGIWDWCSDPENNPKGIGGQPDDPNTPENEGNGNNGRGRG